MVKISLVGFGKRVILFIKTISLVPKTTVLFLEIIFLRGLISIANTSYEKGMLNDCPLFVSSIVCHPEPARTEPVEVLKCRRRSLSDSTPWTNCIEGQKLQDSAPLFQGTQSFGNSLIASLSCRARHDTS